MTQENQHIESILPWINVIIVLTIYHLEFKTHIDSLTTRLTTPLKDNEKPLIEEEINNNSDENNDENIQSILEKLEQNIDNQFEILYQKWSDYDSL